MYKLAFTDEDNLDIFDAHVAISSNEYNSYLVECSQLEKIDLKSLDKNEKVAFFLNIYQCMYIHNYLRMEFEGKVPKSNESMFSKIKNYVLDYSSKPFFYNIGGINFDLDQIKHGILRGNRKSPIAY